MAASTMSSGVSIEAGLRDQDADLLPDRTTSVEEGLLPDAEHLAHHVADFAEGRLRPHGIEDERHRVVVALARRAQTVERSGVLLRVSRSAKLPEAVDLGLERRFAHAERLDIGLLVDDEIVDTDDRALLVLDLPLVAVRRVCDLLLEESLPDGGDHATEVLDPLEGAIGLLLEFVRERLEEVRAAERVHRVRRAALVGKDLLGPQGDPRGLLVRDLIRLVVRVRVEGLRSAEDRRKRLDRRPDDVDLRLL